MLVYSSGTFIRGHANRKNPYYNYSHDRYVRDTMCSHCNEMIGEQVNYPHFDAGYRFETEEKNRYKFCPYCGEKL